jgi:inosine-uridine nucleoside N-ribohydrolase
VALPVILDCDPGHDDAVALIIAARHTDLLGVTTVAGNASLEHTTRNALTVLEWVDHAAPVHRGADRPLLAAPRHGREVHGSTGMGDVPFPMPARTADGDDAAAFIVETARAREGAWLVATGPLTNVALALRRAPDLADRLAGISLMGGSAGVGNRTPVAEYNVWADPEAAAIVFAYGGPLVMAGLHVTYGLQATPARLTAVQAAHRRLGPVVAQLLASYSRFYLDEHTGFSGAPVHDACAVLALTHPELFARRAAHVVVETTGQHTRGMTVVDQRPLARPLAPNADVLVSVDDDAAFRVIVDTVAAAPPT